MIHGDVASGFEGVREEFLSGFAERGETGAALTALVDGRMVVDLWGGNGFGPDSLVNVYSVTKPMAAFCVLVLVDRGLLGLDDPVAQHWPEFAQAGKERVTVRQLLSHQSRPGGASRPAAARRSLRLGPNLCAARGGSALVGAWYRPRRARAVLRPPVR